MADTTFRVERIVFDIKPDYTEVEVWCGPPSDGMLGVQGCHKKTFPKETSCLDILTGPIAKTEYLTW